MIELEDRVPGGCDHCGTVSRALTPWPQQIHDTCPCLCHSMRTSRAIAERKTGRRRGKK